MEDEINPRIIEKIEELKNTKIRDFLKDIIFIEFGKRDEAKWPFRDEYDHKIKKFLEEK